MSVFSEWPHQWLDVPNDLTGLVEGLPPLPDWIDEHWQPADLPQIVEYLRTAPIYTYTLTPTELSCVKCGEILDGVSMFRWDNAWLWNHTLHHYVEFHSVRLPDRMVAHIRKRMYRPPIDDECDLHAAEVVFDKYLALVLRAHSKSG